MSSLTAGPSTSAQDDRVDLGRFGQAVAVLFLAELLLAVALSVLVTPVLWLATAMLAVQWALWSTVIR